jgi:dihydrofolate reductase
MLADEDMHRHAAESIAQADALLFGRVTYELMEAGWRPFARTGARPERVPAARQQLNALSLGRLTRESNGGA